MIPSIQGQAAVDQTYADAVRAQPEFADFDDKSITAKANELFADTSADGSTVWITKAVADGVAAKDGAEQQALVAAFVFLCVCGMFILIYTLSDIACRNRSGRMLAQSESGDGI